jgi:hypothetical protein
MEGNRVKIRVGFTVLLGTRERQKLLQDMANTLPSNVFMQSFQNALLGRATTNSPLAGTLPPPATPGDVTDADLQAYMDVPATIKGNTELILKNAQVGVDTVEEQEGKLKPIFTDSMKTFLGLKHDVIVNAVQTAEMQDTSGGGGATNITVVISWTANPEHGGKFQKDVKERGHALLDGLYTNVMSANLPCMVGVTLDSWTRLHAMYYGNVVQKLPRGPELKQRFGHYQAAGVFRNDTGTSPFVEHPSGEITPETHTSDEKPK